MKRAPNAIWIMSGQHAYFATGCYDGGLALPRGDSGVVRRIAGNPLGDAPPVTVRGSSAQVPLSPWQIVTLRVL